jgi:hypothetical protein
MADRVRRERVRRSIVTRLRRAREAGRWEEVASLRRSLALIDGVGLLDGLVPSVE